MVGGGGDGVGSLDVVVVDRWDGELESAQNGRKVSLDVGRGEESII